MKKIGLLCFTVLVCVFALTSTTPKIAGKTDKLRKSLKAIPNRYIVVLNDEKGDDSNSFMRLDSFENELNAFYDGRVDRQFTNAIKGYSVEMSENEALNLSQDTRIKYVEEDAEVFAMTTQTSATWGLDRIDQHAFPLDTNYTYAPTGAGVHAYIIDTGIRVTHQDFGGRAVADFDAFNDGQNGIDCNGHGTHVAGTVGSSTYGVAKNVTLHAVRVMDCSAAGTISTIIAGVDYVTSNHASPAVANISLGASGISDALDTAIANSVASGVTYAVAAGNSNQDACNYSPSRASSAITVGASTNLDERFGISNYGTCVDIFAPGVNIISTSVASDTAITAKSGTSMASPHVAGVAALYLETNPTASPGVVASLIVGGGTPGTLINIIGTNSPNLLLYSLVAGTDTTTVPDRHKRRLPIRF